MPLASAPSAGAPRVDRLAREALQSALKATGDTPAVVEHTWSAMGGRARTLVVGAPQGSAERAETIARSLEERWSRFRDDSDISLLNSAQGSPVTVARSTVDLIAAMTAAWRETDRDYDPTLLPALLATGYQHSWGDPHRATRVPVTARSRRSLDEIVIDGLTVTLAVGTTLDPGGIGKGLAADMIAAALIESGAWGCLVDVGGDIRVRGQAPDGVAWRVGVEDPFDTTQHRTIVRLRDGGVATSSQLKRRWTEGDGQDAHHIIDPRTGRSAATPAQTVTVLAASAARAEALTKPGFVRPADEYLEWLPTRGAAGLIIDDHGRESVTSNWSDYA